MRKLEKQQILRVNAPGFGMPAHFNVGSAQPLTDYRVVVVNPISILHLFDKDPEVLGQIDAACEQGMGSFPAKSDNLLRSIEPDLKVRYEEMRKFLHQGGLLIYFLCPPFVTKGPTVSLDNYVWLMDLAPDKPIERGSRHMSSVSRGKHMELTGRAESSAFARYLKQAGLEWTTLVRAENLTDGYEILSMAGPSKCVAGRLNVGHGQAVFLPGPYTPDYDEKLSECLKLWCASRSNWPITEDVTYSEDVAENFLNGSGSSASSGASAAAAGAEPEPSAHQAPDLTPLPPLNPAARPDTPLQAGADGIPAVALHNYYNSPASHEESGQSAKAQSDTNADQQGHSAHTAEHSQAQAEPAGQGQAAAAEAAEPAETEMPKTFIKKIETISRAVYPDWVKSYSLPELDEWSHQLDQLSENLRLTSLKIAELNGRAADMHNMKNSLLWADSGELIGAVSKSFEKLGWQTHHEQIELGDPHTRAELWLNLDKTTEALVHVMRTEGQPQRSSLARLAERLISFWDEHENEPKGIVVANTWADTPNNERTAEDYPPSLIEFAAKKHLCLMTTRQLLSLYRNMEMESEEAQGARQKILTTNGLLDGYDLPGSAGAETAPAQRGTPVGSKSE